jgi:hypothetical protein
MERKIRTYKAEDKPYAKAKKRGNGKLATLVENFIHLYGMGADTIHVEQDYLWGSGKTTKIQPTPSSKPKK